MTHRKIHRFQVNGIIRDDADFIRLRNQYENLLTHQMRITGYVRVLDINPAFSVQFNTIEQNYDFVFTMHGVFVGKRKAWHSEGMVQGQLIHRYTPHYKSELSSERSMSK